MDYDKMRKGLKAELKKRIPSFETIRCVRINENDHFFLIRNTPKHNGQDVNYEDNGYGLPVAVCYGEGNHDYDDCIIIHNNNFKNVKAYISKYRFNIEGSLEFLVNTILEEANKGEKELRIESQSLTPIKDLFRAVGLLPEKRGRNKNKYQGWRKKRDAAIVVVFHRISRARTINKNFPLKAIRAGVKKHIPNRWKFKDADEFRKVEQIFDVSDAVIRRVLKPYLKK